MHKKYLKYYLLFIFLLGIPAAHNLLFLYRIGELYKPAEIARIQNSQAYCIYGSGINDDVLSNKMAMYELRKPEIVALGSSRVLQLREKFFNRSFYNLGFTVDSVFSADKIVDLALQYHKPKLIIMNIDFWWFHPEYRNPEIDNMEVNSIRPMEINYIMLPIRWLKKSKISSKDFFELPYSLDKSQCGIGAKGYERNAGYAPDGSYYYTDVITGSPYSEKTGVQSDYKFKDISQRIDKGTQLFNYGNKVDGTDLTNFLKILAKLKAQNIDVVLFFPPLAPKTIELMKAHDYSYIEDLKAKLRQNNVIFYDYSNYALTRSSNCEFIDGFHGGDLLHAKILLDIAQHDSTLKNLTNQKYLNEVVAKYNGLAMIPDAHITNKLEYDFLDIGCTKSLKNHP